MKEINDFSAIIESMLNLTDTHKFQIEFQRLDSGKIYIIVSDGFGEIVYTSEKDCSLAIQTMIESCQDWIDEQTNNHDNED